MPTKKIKTENLEIFRNSDNKYKNMRDLYVQFSVLKLSLLRQKKEKIDM